MADFVIRTDEPEYEITIHCRWGYKGIPRFDAVRAALTHAYAMAFAEVDKRLGETN